MTRRELERRLHSRLAAAGLRWSRAEVRTALEVFLEIVEAALKAGEPVGLPDFGTLEVVERAPRKGYHFPTGEPVEIPPQKTVRFRPSRKLKKALAL